MAYWTEEYTKDKYIVWSNIEIFYGINRLLLSSSFPCINL